MIDKDIYCLWVDKDTGEVSVIAVTTPLERVPLGGHVPTYRGSKAVMERRKRQLIRKMMRE